MSLEYRRHAKASWSGSARHPDKFRRVEIFRSLNPTPCVLSAMPGGMANASRPHSKLRTRSPLSEMNVSRENAALVQAFVRNRVLFTVVHSHAGAQKSSGAFFRDYAGERCRKRPARVRMALRASQGVRPRDVMVNSANVRLTFISFKSYFSFSFAFRSGVRTFNDLTRWERS